MEVSSSFFSHVTSPQLGSVPELLAFIICPTTTESPRYNMFPGTLSTNGSVPEPILADLFQYRFYQEIEKILDSNKYTKDVLQAWILNPQRVEFANEASFFDFFYRVCTDRLVPTDLVVAIIRVLGEENLNSYTCLDCLKSIVTSKRNTEDKICILLEVLEILKKVPESKASILATVLISSNNDKIILAALESGFIDKETLLIRHAIMTEVKNCMFARTKSIQEVEISFPLDYGCFEHEATILEIAIHKKMEFRIIKKLIEIGGRELLSLSKRSLLQGVLLEYNGNTAIEMSEHLLEIGGKDLVMMKICWKPEGTTSILDFLSYQKHNLQKTIGLHRVAKIMKRFIDLGERELVMRLSYNVSVLHEFRYFQHEEFIPVIRLLVNIGGIELLSNREPLYFGDKGGYTILHKLCQSETDDISDEVWKILACNKDIVMMVDKHDQTALHLACKTNRRDCIAVLLEQGGKDLVFRQDRKKNTALHYLPSTRKKGNAHFDIAEKILRVGGRELLECKNKSKNTPFIPFIAKALEFKFESTSGMIESGETNIDEDIMKQDDLGKTALHIACERNNCNEVRSLLERGGKALTLMRDARGNTALHLLNCTSRKNCSDFEIAEMILNVGGKELLECQNNAKQKPFLPFIAKAIDFQFNLVENVPDFISSNNNDAIGNSNSFNVDLSEAEAETLKIVSDSMKSLEENVFGIVGRYCEKMRVLEEKNKRLKAQLHVKDQEITRLRQETMKRSREEDMENEVSEHFVTPYKKTKVSEAVVTSTNRSCDLDPNNFEFSL